MTKPYDFVPFLKCELYEKRGKLEGIIPITIKTLTPIHISSGQLTSNDNKTLYKSFIRNNRDIIIPGSSLKGCIRAIAETVSYSCLDDRELDFKKLPKNKNHKKESHNRCIICDTFGTMGFKSKVTVNDMKMVKGRTEIISLPKSFSPRPNTTEYVDDRNKYKGYKFYKHGINGIQSTGNIPYEFVLEGAEFEGKIIFKGLTDEQIELLCFSMGLNGEFEPKIGYGKSFYYGSVELLSEGEWVKKAIQYKKSAKEDILENIEILEDLLSFKNAVKSLD